MSETDHSNSEASSATTTEPPIPEVDAQTKSTEGSIPTNSPDLPTQAEVDALVIELDDIDQALEKFDS